MSEPITQQHKTSTILAVMLAFVAIVVALGAGGWWFYLRDEPGTDFNGVTLPGHQAPAIALTDQHGQPFSLESVRGKVVLLYFGYTACPDFCPTTLVDLIQVEKDLGEKADQVEVVMVTVDPARDTSQRLAEYLEFFNPGFIGLTGSEQDLRMTARNFGVAYKQDAATPAASQYLVDHTTSIFGIDPAGNLVVTWAYGTDADLITSDVEQMLE